MTTRMRASENLIDRLETIPVEQIMHAGFIGCPLETPLRSVAKLMADHRVHCVVGFGDATEDDTDVWGVVSDADVVAALAGGCESASAGEVASAEVVTMRPDESVRRAAQLMQDHEVSHVLVVGRSSRPIGIVSTLDVMAVAGGKAL
jgi:CBS domain-containing protein